MGHPEPWNLTYLAIGNEVALPIPLHKLSPTNFVEMKRKTLSRRSGARCVLRGKPPPHPIRYRLSRHLDNFSLNNLDNFFIHDCIPS
jgi:hypothetical protein